MVSSVDFGSYVWWCCWLLIGSAVRGKLRYSGGCIERDFLFLTVDNVLELVCSCERFKQNIVSWILLFWGNMVNINHPWGFQTRERNVIKCEGADGAVDDAVLMNCADGWYWLRCRCLDAAEAACWLVQCLHQTSNSFVQTCICMWSNVQTCK